MHFEAAQAEVGIHFTGDSGGERLFADGIFTSLRFWIAGCNDCDTVRRGR